MVLGRRTFTWRSDVRGLVTVVLLALATLVSAVVLVALTLVVTGWLAG